MTDVSYIVSPYSTAASSKSCGGKHKHAHDANSTTTGASGSAFELLLNGQANGDGTTTDALTNRDETDGTFSTTAETGTGSDLGSAYQSLLAMFQTDGGMDDASAAQLNDALSQRVTKSANQNQFVDSPVNDLNSKLNLDAKA